MIKNFLNKWKNQSLFFRILFIISTLWFLISLIFFTKTLLNLSGIETAIRFILIGILIIHLVVLILGGLVCLYTSKKKSFITLIVLTLIYSPLLNVASFYIDKAYNIIDTVQKKYVTYTSVMIALNNTTEYKKIGMISAKDDPTGYVIPQEIIKSNNIDASIVSYDDYIGMLADLYDGVIDAMFVADSYASMFKSFETFEKIEEETKVVYTMSKEMENVDNISYTTKNLTEPFTILLMGIDGTGNNISSTTSFNGDTLMLITINPKTLSSTIFSIPRDTFVPIACNQNRENKINSSAYGGTSCVVNTIEALTGIDIDYYVKINFTGVMNLVDDLGGIDVDVPITFCEQDSERRFGSHLICLEKGMQTLNGEQALALARHRHSLPLGDFQRIQHQQLIVEAMLKKVKNIRDVNDFYTILEDVANNIDTNMTTNQILSLYDVLKHVLINMINDELDFSIQKTYLTGYDLTIYMPIYQSYIYTFQYYKQSLEEITHAMKVNLELESPTIIKTFSFDINNNYEIPIIGKTYYSETRRELLPSFIGLEKEDVESWALEREIEITFEESESAIPDGIIIKQSEVSGTLVENIDSITITLSKQIDIPQENEPEKNTLTLPNFTGYTLDEFNKWKNSLTDVNLIIECLELSVEDILTLDEVDLISNTIYKQSSPEGTDIENISNLTVYYYN